MSIIDGTDIGQRMREIQRAEKRHLADATREFVLGAATAAPPSIPKQYAPAGPSRPGQTMASTVQGFVPQNSGAGDGCPCMGACDGSCLWEDGESDGRLG